MNIPIVSTVAQDAALQSLNQQSNKNPLDPLVFAVSWIGDQLTALVSTQNVKATQADLSAISVAIASGVITQSDLDTLIASKQGK